MGEIKGVAEVDAFKKVKTNIDALPAGIYIVRQDGTAKKIAVK